MQPETIPEITVEATRPCSMCKTFMIVRTASTKWEKRRLYDSLKVAWYCDDCIRSSAHWDYSE